MNFKLRNLVAATLAGSFLMGFGANAMADSTTDIVNALVAKGVLTEEEGALLTKGRTDEAAGQAKALKKAGKLKISDAIDSATVYGDVRVRYEHREGQGVGATASTAPNAGQTVERGRYKVTLGVKTESGNWYTDLALAMGSRGRSDNATFASFVGSNVNTKEALYVKRAMVGFKATDWLTLEAGRMDNPLYTTPMVWDADLTVEGLAEKVNYKVNDNLALFGTAMQASYSGVGGKTSFTDPNSSAAGANTTSNEQLAFQGGAKYNFNDSTSGKAALTYSMFTHGGAGVASATTGFNPGTGAASIGYSALVNDLDTIEIPAEINYMTSSNIGVRLFGDYVYNTSADDRAKHSGISAAANGSSGSDDTAWMLGVMVGSAKDLKAFEGNKMAKGDWSARLWYQDVGVWAVDQNTVDSDFMDSRVNMQGTVFKTAYNVQDNVIVNFAYGHAKRKNDTFGTNASANAGANDLALNLKSFDLLQFDLTYKF